MKKQLFLGCCAALVLGSGCASSDSGGTSDQSGAVSGSGYREFYYADPEHRDYYWKEPWTAPAQPVYKEYNYNYVDPHRDFFGVWKQPSLNGTDWIGARPEFYWYR